MRRPVFVAGRGAVSGFGVGVRALADGVFAGQTSLRQRRRTAGYEAATNFVGEIPDGCFDREVIEIDLPKHSALTAIEEALTEAGQPDRSKTGMVLATTKADMSGI